MAATPTEEEEKEEEEEVKEEVWVKHGAVSPRMIPPASPPASPASPAFPIGSLSDSPHSNHNSDSGDSGPGDTGVSQHSSQQAIVVEQPAGCDDGPDISPLKNETASCEEEEMIQLDANAEPEAQLQPVLATPLGTNSSSVSDNEDAVADEGLVVMGSAKEKTLLTSSPICPAEQSTSSMSQTNADSIHCEASARSDVSVCAAGSEPLSSELSTEESEGAGAVSATGTVEALSLDLIEIIEQLVSAVEV